MAEAQNRGGKRPGSGRKALGDKKAVSVSVYPPQDTLDKIDAIAAAENKSRSKVILDLINKALGGK